MFRQDQTVLVQVFTGPTIQRRLSRTLEKRETGTRPFGEIHTIRSGLEHWREWSDRRVVRTPEERQGPNSRQCGMWSHVADLGRRSDRHVPDVVRRKNHVFLVLFGARHVSFSAVRKFVGASAGSDGVARGTDR